MQQDNGLRRELLGALVLLTALTIILTWPQALYLGTKVPDHDDPFLSMWRLEWIAHALRTDIRHLFDGNIFYPFVRTLAFSDATLLEGLLAAPWLWAHANPVLVYNLLLLTGMVSSGLGMFLLVRYLTASGDAALVGTAIFTLAPYRIEHFMHLELQWTAWMPLTFWAVHRACDTGLRRHGLLAGGLLSLQAISSLYYGAYLAIIASVLSVLLALSRPRTARAALGTLLTGAVIPAVVVAVYAWPYVMNARVLGRRSPDEIASFSAQLASYVAAPQENWLWGWTASQFSGDELRLFPGTVAVALALIALALRPHRLVWIYVATVAVAVELSLGFNGTLYRWLFAHVWALQGFRAPARFAILACCGLGVLAGFGFQRLQHLASASRIRGILLTSVLVAIGIESGSTPMRLISVPTAVPSVYRFLASARRTIGPSVVIELPLDDPDPSPVYMFWSTRHWNPLVNGYSGFKPRAYRETVARMRTFPDDAAFAQLRKLDVRYILVHESFYPPKQYAAVMLRLARRSDVISVGRFHDWAGVTEVFELRLAGRLRKPDAM